MAQTANASLEKKIRGAIKKLTEESQPITNQNVCAMVGGGSFRDINPLVKLVKAQIAAEEEAAREAPDMPEGFHDELCPKVGDGVIRRRLEVA